MVQFAPSPTPFLGPQGQLLHQALNDQHMLVGSGAAPQWSSQERQRNDATLVMTHQ